MAAIFVRLAFWSTPVGTDEGGYLMVASQWGDGSSLYGDYWVDRPPLLIGIFDIADSLGGIDGLRFIALLAAIGLVAGTAFAAWAAGGLKAASWAAPVAAVLGTVHWLGAARVNGELLAIPFVVTAVGFGIFSLKRAQRPWSMYAAGFAAGALAVCGPLIKQNFIDAFVFLGVYVTFHVFGRTHLRRRALVLAAWAVVGAAVVLALVLMWSAGKGTGPRELLDAILTARVEAGSVIASEASSATGERAIRLVAVWFSSGIALLGAYMFFTLVKTRALDRALAAVAVMWVFGACSVLLGGSYWLHYLLQLVPATALAVGLLAARQRTRVLVGLVAATVALSFVNNGWTLVVQDTEDSNAEATGTWLGDSAEPGDSGIVAYGQANVLWHADMDSPYEHLWSLPIRTRDSNLKDFTEAITGVARPTWLVVWNELDSWGVDADLHLNGAVGRFYREVADVCGHKMFLRQDTVRELAPSPRNCEEED